MNYYGIRTEEEIKKIVHDVCVFFGNNDPNLIKRSEALCNETLCAESIYGRAEDKSVHTGMGISQIDPIAIKDIKKHGGKWRDSIWKKWKVDINLLHIEQLRYDEFMSILCMRLVYKRNPDPIPNTRSGRAHYWKKVYNTELGKGTVEHYLSNSNTILGKE